MLIIVKNSAKIENSFYTSKYFKIFFDNNEDLCQNSNLFLPL